MLLCQIVHQKCLETQISELMTVDGSTMANRAWVTALWGALRHPGCPQGAVRYDAGPSDHDLQYTQECVKWCQLPTWEWQLNDELSFVTCSTQREHIFLDRPITKTATWGLRGKQFSPCSYMSRQQEAVGSLETLRKSMVHRPVSWNHTIILVGRESQDYRVQPLT